MTESIRVGDYAVNPSSKVVGAVGGRRSGNRASSIKCLCFGFYASRIGQNKHGKPLRSSACLHVSNSACHMPASYIEVLESLRAITWEGLAEKQAANLLILCKPRAWVPACDEVDGNAQSCLAPWALRCTRSRSFRI